MPRLDVDGHADADDLEVRRGRQQDLGDFRPGAVGQHVERAVVVLAAVFIDMVGHVGEHEEVEVAHHADRQVDGVRHAVAVVGAVRVGAAQAPRMPDVAHAAVVGVAQHVVLGHDDAVVPAGFGRRPFAVVAHGPGQRHRRAGELVVGRLDHIHAQVGWRCQLHQDRGADPGVVAFEVVLEDLSVGIRAYQEVVAAEQPARYGHGGAVLVALADRQVVRVEHRGEGDVVLGGGPQVIQRQDHLVVPVARARGPGSDIRHHPADRGLRAGEWLGRWRDGRDLQVGEGRERDREQGVVWRQVVELARRCLVDLVEGVGDDHEAPHPVLGGGQGQVLRAGH